MWLVTLSLAVCGVALLSALLTTCLLPRLSSRDWWLASLTLGLAALTGGVRLFGALHWLNPRAGLLGLGIANIVAALLARKAKAPRFSFRPPSLGLSGWAAVVVAGSALLLAVLAACWLPIWQWDSLGYHLPYVNFALQRGGLDGVPADVPYLSTYPHNIEFVFLALRLCLPDDRLLDLGQIGFGLLGAIMAFALARRLGARRGPAVAAGCLWLAVPAVFLQLPTNYVDVGAAAYLLLASYWVVSRPRRERVVLAGLAIGLFMGSKPSSLVPAAILVALLVVRAFRARLWGWLFPAGALAALFGVESFVTNWWRYGNPVWPITVKLGPWQLPGLESLQDVLSTGSAVPHLQDHAWWRVFQAWGTLVPWPVFDTRVGGFGLAFLFTALPGALWALRDRRRWVMLPVLLAAIASPDPAIARYTLAFPALCFALAAAGLSRIPQVWRARAVFIATATATASMSLAFPGLTGGWPYVFSYASRTPDEAFELMGPENPPRRWLELRRANAVLAYDRSFELPYLLWRSDLSNTVLRIPDHLAGPALERWLQTNRVTAFVAGDRDPAGALARRKRDRFAEVFPCESGLCHVYRVASMHEAQ